MTALSSNPLNKNFLSPLSFQVAIQRSPNLNFTVQNSTLPGIMLDNVDTNNPFVRIPHAGDHIYYEELSMQFLVDEDLNNWLEMHDWIRGLGFPNRWEEYEELHRQPKYSGLGIKSDITMLVANSSKNLRIQVVYKDAFPIALSSIQFDTTLTDIQYLTAFVTFAYTSYDISRLPTTSS